MLINLIYRNKKTTFYSFENIFNTLLTYFGGVIDKIELSIEIKEIKIITNVELGEKLIRKGIENIKRVKPQKLANKYIEIYQSMLNEK